MCVSGVPLRLVFQFTNLDCGGVSDEFRGVDWCPWTARAPPARTRGRLLLGTPRARVDARAHTAPSRAPCVRARLHEHRRTPRARFGAGWAATFAAGALAAHHEVLTRTQPLPQPSQVVADVVAVHCSDRDKLGQHGV